MFQSGFWDVGSKARWSPGHANFPQGKETPLEIQWSASGLPNVIASTEMSPVWAEDSLPSFHQFTGGAEERIWPTVWEESRRIIRTWIGWVGR